MAYETFHGSDEEPFLDRYLRGYFPDYGHRGVMLDVGAGLPVRCSNSYHFEMNGWTVYCIEPNPESAIRLRKERKHVIECAASCANLGRRDFTIVHTSRFEMMSASSLEVIDDFRKEVASFILGESVVEVEVRTLDCILEDEIGNVRSIDILSVDVEGHELDVLKGCSLDRWRPKVILLENYFGTDECRAYLANSGYRLDQQVPRNDFFIRVEDAARG